MQKNEFKCELNEWKQNREKIFALLKTPRLVYNAIYYSIHPSSRSERSYVVLSVCTLANFCNYLYLPNAAAVSVSGCCVSIYSVADALADADGAASNTLLASF